MELSVKKKAYQWAYPIKKPVAIPAGGKSFTIGALAPQTSSHRFVAVAEFADGKKVESKAIDFLYFRPRKVELPYEDRSQEVRPDWLYRWEPGRKSAASPGPAVTRPAFRFEELKHDSVQQLVI